MEIHQELDPALTSRLSSYILQDSFNRSHAIKIAELKRGLVRFELSQLSDVANSQNLIHGGVLMSCATNVMDYALETLNLKSLLIEQSTSFLRPGRPDLPLICIGQVIKTGRTICVVQGDLFCGDLHVTNNLATYSVLGPAFDL